LVALAADCLSCCLARGASFAFDFVSTQNGRD
jgi:hypothetical protein